MKLPDLIARIDELIQKADKVLATKQVTHNYIETVNTELFNELRTMSLSFLGNIFGVSHPIYTEFNEKAQHADPLHAERGRGILKAAKSEIEGGWFYKIKNLVSADIFTNFLDMSEYLENEGYKDAAAVIIGSVLEEHLRQLCLSNSIPTTEINKDSKEVPLKADRLNAELAKIEIYNKLVQKNITAWLDLRNNAAHGKYSEYTKEQVNLMQQGVSDFIGNYFA